MLPKYLSISTLYVLLLMTPLSGLRCFKCKICILNLRGIEECRGDENACMKTTLGGIIRKNCINDQFCSAERFEEGIKKTWHGIKILFGDREKEDEKDQAFSCCHSDLCNSGRRLRSAFGTLVASCLLIKSIFFLIKY